MHCRPSRTVGLNPRMFALFALTLCVEKASSKAPPTPLPISVTASTPATLGAPIQISWTLKNTTTAPLNGFIVYYSDSNAVSSTSAPNNLIVAGNHTVSGTFTFANPGPGSHLLGVSLLDRHGTPPAVTHQPLQPIEVGSTPKAPTPPSVSVTDVSIAATGYARVVTSQEVRTLAGLTPDQKNNLLNRYAPLLLFSYDHDLQEQYAPIDVLDFIKGSTLVSQIPNVIPSMPNSSLQVPDVILGTSSAVAINPAQTNLPLNVYVSPSTAAEHGTWNAVVTNDEVTNPHVGLYGHLVLQSLQNVTDNVIAGGATPKPSDLSVLEQELALRYNCKDLDPNCPAQIIKLEYWQFFGYSHDYQNPTPLTNLIVPGTTAILADLIDHGGDWCTVQLYVDADWALYSNRPDKAILAIYHYAHGVQFGFDLSRVTNPNPSATNLEGFSIQELQGPFYGQPVSTAYKPHETDNSVQAAQNNVVQLAQDPSSKLYIHPVVYVEWGGHEFFPSPAWSVGEASKHNGTGKYHYIAQGVPDIGEIGAANPPTDQAKLITSFAGFWGYYGTDNQNKPPPGPPLHKQWVWDPDMPPALLKVRPSLDDLPF
jgi:hypothetical protein